MKKIKRTKNLKRKILIIIACLLLAGVTIFCLELFNIIHFVNPPAIIEQAPTVLIDTNPPTTDQKAAGEAQKTETDNPTSNNDLGISITSIYLSGDPIQIRSVINGAISNSGTCILSLTRNGITVTKTVETYAMPSSSTCKGFDINKNELSSGEWQITLTVNIEGKESSITDSFSLE